MIRITHGTDYVPIRYTLLTMNPLVGSEFRYKIVCDVIKEYDMVDGPLQAEAISSPSDDFYYGYNLSHLICCGIDCDDVSDILKGMWMDIWDIYLTHGYENPIQITGVVFFPSPSYPSVV